MQSVPVTMDTKGRVRTSYEQRCDILAAFERAGEYLPSSLPKRTALNTQPSPDGCNAIAGQNPRGQPSIMRLLEAVVEQTQEALLS